jgi:polysaccharide export outer membrane protein
VQELRISRMNVGKEGRHYFVDVALLTLTIAFIVGNVVGCASTGVEQPPTKSGSQPVASKKYRVQPGDTLFISVWREETLQREVVVPPDGRIRFPLAGEVNVTGLSLAEVERRLKENLSAYLPDPAISVSLIQASGNRIYVVGRVNAPGEYVLSRDIDVLQAIALAGGLTPFAKKKKIKILRKEKGNQRVFHFNYKELEKGRRVSQNMLLKPGDTIIVP